MNILKILFLLVFISFFKPSEECSNIYLIRHAEKVRANKSDRDPDLSNKGFLRAENWKKFFIDKNISKIYSTNYKRTIKTVKPLAENNSLDIILYSSDDVIYETFLKSSIGENTLVVGHSNTIPGFVNELIEEDYYEQINDTVNSNLYIVKKCPEEINHNVIQIHSLQQ